ncbi:MAG: hypothetical protein QNL62_17580 [Gammaproteobacteria bacterium]|nr:hypothetical protein [Gammaproteobacteria bacterium]
MSIFQIEERITLNSFDDIIHRPCYKSQIKPKKYHYVRILAGYSFKDENAICGVSDCHKPHNQGFLVTTSNEEETNLCEACGQRFFSVSFDKQKKILKEEDNIRNQKIRFNKILDQDIVKKRVNELKKTSRGANWLYQVSTSFCNTYPLELLSALKELATNKDENTILDRLVKNQAHSSQIENVKQLQGLNIFLSDVREELVDKILKPLLELQKITDNPDSKSSLTRYCNWADTLDEQFTYVEELLEEGRKFFETWNLERIKSIPLSNDSARLVRSLSWNINKALKRPKPTPPLIKY